MSGAPCGASAVNPSDHTSQVLADQREARRVDRILARESSGRFRSMRHLVTTPGYTPTLRVTRLADAYDAAQAARGDARRACR